MRSIVCSNRAGAGPRRQPGARGAGSRGFTMVELVLVIGVTATVLAAGVATYVGTMHSVEGTVSLAEVQREASIAMDMIARSVRTGGWAEINADADSLSVYVETESGDSLTAAYYLQEGTLRDIDGTVLVTNIAALVFEPGTGRTINIDVTLADDMGTPEVASDDQTALVSSTVGCRN